MSPEEIDEARKQTDESVGNALRGATGSGYRAIQAAYLIVRELRLMSAEIVNALHDTERRR